MFNSIHQNLALFVPKHSQNSEICEISGPKIPFLKKQTQFFPLSSPKTAIPPNPNPIQSQFKPNQTQFKPNFMAFYAKRTQLSPFSAQKPRFHQKTNPKQTQTKPNRWIAKMNVCPLLTKHYEKIRLFDRNENKPKSNPNQTKTQVPKTRKFNPNSLVPIYRDWRGNPFRLKLQDLICIPIHEFNPNSLALKTVASF